MEVKNQHVLVTGGAKRLGKAITLSLLKNAAKVTVHYHQSQSEALEISKVHPEYKDKIHLVQADLNRINEIERAVASAEKKFGPVAILINSASCFFPKKIAETTEEDWDTLSSTNLKGQFFFAKEVAKSMLTLPCGTIINISDTLATKGAKNYSAYLCHKAGLSSLTKSFAKEWAPKIRVNTISPGPILPPENYTEEQKEKSITKTLLNRWGNESDITNAIQFLIGNDYITGVDLPIDGGEITLLKKYHLLCRFLTRNAHIPSEYASLSHSEAPCI